MACVRVIGLYILPLGLYLVENSRSGFSRLILEKTRGDLLTNPSVKCPVIRPVSGGARWNPITILGPGATVTDTQTRVLSHERSSWALRYIAYGSL